MDVLWLDERLSVHFSLYAPVGKESGGISPFCCQGLSLLRPHWLILAAIGGPGSGRPSALATGEPAGSVGDSSALRGLPQAPGGPAPPAGLGPGPRLGNADGAKSDRRWSTSPNLHCILLKAWTLEPELPVSNPG